MKNEICEEISNALSKHIQMKESKTETNNDDSLF